MVEVLYITTQGVEVKKKGRSLLIAQPQAPELELEIPQLLAVCVFGGVHISTPAIKALLKEGVELAYLSASGTLLGQLTPPRPRNIALRLRQYEIYSTQSERLTLARRLVAAKITNARHTLNYYRRNYPLEPAMLKPAMKKLTALTTAARTAPDCSVLRGIEGNAAQEYFTLLAQFIRHPDFSHFAGRRHHPPPDPFNTLLSLTYTLLGREIMSLLDALGFDPYLGFYHTVYGGRPALALDLLELLRHPCADILVLSLVNRRVFTASDFNYRRQPPAVYLKREALKRYLPYYENFLTRSRSALGNKSWRESLWHYARDLAIFFNQKKSPELFPVFTYGAELDETQNP